MEKTPSNNTQDVEVRKGPWTLEEDLTLINYIVNHGEGVWNSLARSAGLKRTGKSCRLRWLNYLRPDVRRGNITHEEQQLIMDLHARWGNRWSKIARQLPGRTDNEIKNFWRTRIQRQIKQETKQNNIIEPAQDGHHANSIYATRPSASMDESVATCSDHQPMPSTGNIIAESFADPMLTDSINNGFWSLEDIWTTQFFNGD